MKSTASESAGLFIRMARIWSGLFLLTFVTCHLLNLSLGVISLSAMDAARPYLSGIWASPILGLPLLAALVVHFLLGLWAIYRRPILQTNFQDMVQLFTGIVVVPLMATHVVGVAALKINETPFDYATAARFFWVVQPSIGLLQVVLLSAVWIHGCAGLFTWLRSKDTMRNMLGWLYPLALAVPVLALLGFGEAGRSVLIEAAANAAAAPSVEVVPPAPAAPATVPYETVQFVTSQIIWWSLALAALTFAARALHLRLNPRQTVRLQRGDAPYIATTSDLSILDSFRQNNQLHASLCEGRGRCGTCAVRVVMSEFPLPEPTALERKTLSRIGAAADIRLACQVMPSGGFLEVEPLYPADYSFKDEDYSEEERRTDPTGATA